MSRSRKFDIISAFDAAPARYETAAGLQRDVAGNLAGRIARLKHAPMPRVLEIGCGTGFLTDALRPALPNAAWTVSDIAPGMVDHCRAKFAGGDSVFLAMDGERPALRGGFDVICASLVFQWFEDLPASLGRLAALLNPGGHLAFATLVRGTFREWRAAHRMFGLNAATPAFPSAADIAGSWAESWAGYWPDDISVRGEGSVEEEEFLQTYKSARDFLLTLKAIGADTPAAGRRPLDAGSLRRILRHLDKQGSLTITYQVAYGIFTRS
ncbi:MAG: methyltransferase [Rhodospirillales bacterium]